MDQPKNIHHRFDHIRRWIFFFFSTIILLNVPSLYRETKRISLVKKHMGYQFLGSKFLGLEEFLKNERIVGYYTDRDLDEPGPAMQFSQAQYVLAPILLHLNNTDHEYIIFDCNSPLTAMSKIKEADAVALKRNPYGIILAKKK